MILSHKGGLHVLADSFPLVSTRCFPENTGGSPGDKEAPSVAQVEMLRMLQTQALDIHGLPKTEAGQRHQRPVFHPQTMSLASSHKQQQSIPQG